MSYITAGFASQGLRVFVPDLPGHGRTDGPFSYDRSDQCAQNLVRELTARGLLDPERTILAGHSLGGAIALRVASQIPVAGVVAFSPAPMRPIPGISPEMMPFHDFGALPAHSLLMSAAWEPERIRTAVKNLLPTPGDGSSQYVVIPRSDHVSILFDATAMSDAQNWAARVLHLESHPTLPSHRGVLGFLAGFAGILLLAGPFLREILQTKNQALPLAEIVTTSVKPRVFLEYPIVALGTVALLSYSTPSALCIYSTATTSQAFCSFSEPSFSSCIGIRCEIYSPQARQAPPAPRLPDRFTSPFFSRYSRHCFCIS